MENRGGPSDFQPIPCGGSSSDNEQETRELTSEQLDVQDKCFYLSMKQKVNEHFPRTTRWVWTAPRATSC